MAGKIQDADVKTLSEVGSTASRLTNDTKLYATGAADQMSAAISGGNLLKEASPMTLKQSTTPSNPAAGYNKLYFKSGDNLYMLSSGGAETQVNGTSSPVVLSAGKTGNQSIGNSADVKVTWDAADVDTATAFSSSTFTAPSAGSYLVGVHIEFAGDSTGDRELKVFKNGSLYRSADYVVPPNANTVDMRGSLIVHGVSASDTLEIYVRNTASGAVNITGGPRYNQLYIVKVS